MCVACTGKQLLRTKAQFTSQLMSRWDLSDRPWSANQHTQMRQTTLSTPSFICNTSHTIPFHELKLTEVARLIIFEWERKTFLKISPTCEWDHTSVGPHVSRWSVLSHGDSLKVNCTARQQKHCTLETVGSQDPPSQTNLTYSAFPPTRPCHLLSVWSQYRAECSELTDPCPGWPPASRWCPAVCPSPSAASGSQHLKCVQVNHSLAASPSLPPCVCVGGEGGVERG